MISCRNSRTCNSIQMAESASSYTIIDVRKTHPLESPRFCIMIAFFNRMSVHYGRHYKTSFECVFGKPVYANTIIHVYFNLSGSEFRICNSFSCGKTKEALTEEGEFYDLSNPDNYPCHPDATNAIRFLHENNLFSKFFFSTCHKFTGPPVLYHGPVFHNPSSSDGFIEWMKEKDGKIWVREQIRGYRRYRDPYNGGLSWKPEKGCSIFVDVKRRVCMLGKRTSSYCYDMIYGSDRW